MIKILFICHGNICRSPMAEFVMKDLVRRAGCAGRYEIASAATSSEEIGNPVYPPAQRKLAEHGIGCAGKTARRLTRADYAAWDLLIGMDEENLYNMRRLCGGDPAGKKTCTTCGGFAAATRRARCTCCWNTPTAPARWPTRGIPATLRPPGATSWTAAAACWPPWKRKNERRPAARRPNKNKAACFAARLPPRSFPVPQGKTTQLLRLFAPPQAALHPI